MIRVACLLLLFCVLNEVLAKDCSTARGVNGCSTIDETPYKKKFTPACNKHDICYTCGAARGVRRQSCDERFKVNMKRLCSWDIFCRGAADTYYTVVRIFGERHYNTVSPSWCKESWVPSCMD